MSSGAWTGTVARCRVCQSKPAAQSVATASSTIRTIRKGHTQAPRMPGEPVVQLGHRAEQPGRQAHRQIKTASVT